MRSAVPPAEVIGLGRSVPGDGVEGAVLPPLAPAAGKARQPDRHTEPLGRDCQPAIVLSMVEGRRLEPGNVEPIPPFDGTVLLPRRDRPGVGAAQGAVGQHEHPDNVVGQHEDVGGGAGVRRQVQPRTLAASEAEDRRIGDGGCAHGKVRSADAALAQASGCWNAFLAPSFVMWRDSVERRPRWRLVGEDGRFWSRCLGRGRTAGDCVSAEPLQLALTLQQPGAPLNSCQMQTDTGEGCGVGCLLLQGPNDLYADQGEDLQQPDVLQNLLLGGTERRTRFGS